jgi:hypothetical protein
MTEHMKQTHGGLRNSMDEELKHIGSGKQKTVRR